MTEPLRLTIVYEDAGDSWVTARVPEVPGAISEGATRAQAKKNVIDAIRGSGDLGFVRDVRAICRDSESRHGKFGCSDRRGHKPGTSARQLPVTREHGDSRGRSNW